MQAVPAQKCAHKAHLRAPRAPRCPTCTRQTAKGAKVDDVDQSAARELNSPASLPTSNGAARRTHRAIPPGGGTCGQRARARFRPRDRRVPSPATARANGTKMARRQRAAQTARASGEGRGNRLASGLGSSVRRGAVSGAGGGAHHKIRMSLGGDLDGRQTTKCQLVVSSAATCAEACAQTLARR